MIKKGTIVLLPIPLADPTGASVRPALVFATTRKHAVIAFVTTSKKQSSTHSLTIPATRTTGLTQPSVVHGATLAPIDRAMILGEWALRRVMSTKSRRTQCACVLRL